MSNEELITRLLEESHCRGRRESADEIALLIDHLRTSRWRRRAKWLANLKTVMVVAVAIGISLACVPVYEFSSYRTSQPGSSPEADCQTLHQMINRQ